MRGPLGQQVCTAHEANLNFGIVSCATGRTDRIIVSVTPNGNHQKPMLLFRAYSGFVFLVIFTRTRRQLHAARFFFFQEARHATHLFSSMHGDCDLELCSFSRGSRDVEGLRADGANPEVGVAAGAAAES